MADELDALHTRRGILQAAGTPGMGLVGTTSLASAAQSAQTANSPRAQGGSFADPELTTADILIETLIRWDVRFVFGIVGDGINPIIEALISWRRMPSFPSTAARTPISRLASSSSKNSKSSPAQACSRPWRRACPSQSPRNWLFRIVNRWPSWEMVDSLNSWVNSSRP